MVPACEERSARPRLAPILAKESLEKWGLFHRAAARTLMPMLMPMLTLTLMLTLLLWRGPLRKKERYTNPGAVTRTEEEVEMPSVGS